MKNQTNNQTINQTNNQRTEVLSAPHAYEVLKPLMTADVEEFWCLALGPRKELLACQMLFKGTVDACMVHPRDIFRFACLRNASSVLVAHNHPSNDPIASEQDIRLTEQLIQAGWLLEIPIVDHLIVVKDDYSSLAQKGWCRFLQRSRSI